MTLMGKVSSWMYGITFGFDLKNRNQREDICGAATPIYLDINSKRDLGHLEKYVQALIHASLHATAKKIETKLIVSMNGFLSAIFIRDIFYVEVFKRIITIHHKDGTTDTYAHLSDTEDILSPFGFIRTHRSYIVSSFAIKNLSSTKITLINGEEIPVSKTYYQAVKKAFLGQGIMLGK